MPLSEKSEWLTISGSGSGTELAVDIHDPTFEYKLTVDADTPGVLGIEDEKSPTSSDADVAAQIISKHPTFAAARDLDKFENELRELFGQDSGEFQRFSNAKLNVTSLESLRGKDVEWLEHTWLSPIEIDATKAIKEFLNNYKASLKLRFFGPVTDPNLAAEVYAIQLGRLPTTKEIAGLGTLLGTQVPPIRPEFDVQFAGIQKSLLEAQNLEGLLFAKRSFLFQTFNEMAGTSWVETRSLVNAKREFLRYLLREAVSTRDPISTAVLLGYLPLDSQIASALSGFVGLTTTPTDRLARTVYLDSDLRTGEWTTRTTSKTKSVKLAELPDALKEFEGFTIVVSRLAKLANDKAETPLDFAAIIKGKQMSRDEFLKREKLAAFEPDPRFGQKEVQASKHIHAPKGQELTIEIVGLKEGAEHSGLGDSILIRFPNNRILIIDTSNDGTGLKRVLERLRQLTKDSSTPLEIDVLITHAHRDHVGGWDNLVAGVRKEGWRLNTVVFGKYPNLTASATKLVEQLGQLLSETKISAGVSVFTRRLLVGEAPAVLAVEVSPRAALLELLRGLPGRDTSEAGAHLVLKNTGGVRVEMFQVNNPQTANESSILLRTEVRGVSYLLTGDIDIPAMRKLLKMRQDGEINLSADIMKWPHHVSFPQNWSESDKLVLADFLKAVNPHTVRFSNVGSNQTKEMEDAAIAFIRKTLDTENFRTRIESTNDWKENRAIHLHEEARHIQDSEGGLLAILKYTLTFGKED